MPPIAPLTTLAGRWVTAGGRSHARSSFVLVSDGFSRAHLDLMTEGRPSAYPRPGTSEPSIQWRRFENAEAVGGNRALRYSSRDIVSCSRGHTVPGAAVELTTACLRRWPANLHEKFEEKRHVKRLALVPQRSRPVRVHRPGPRPGLTADDHPVQPGPEPGPQVQRTQQRLAAGEPHRPGARRGKFVQANRRPFL